MADEPTIEQVALEQRAVDPRPPVEPVVDAPVDDQDPQEPVEALEPEPVVETPPKPKKTAEDVLKGRVGHLTKTLNAKEETFRQELETYKSRLSAAEALLAANTPASDGNVTPPLAAPIAGTYTQADFDAAVAARAEAQEFNRKADEMYNVGAEKFSDWKDG